MKHAAIAAILGLSTALSAQAQVSSGSGYQSSGSWSASSGYGYSSGYGSGYSSGITGVYNSGSYGSYGGAYGGYGWGGAGRPGWCGGPGRPWWGLPYYGYGAYGSGYYGSSYYGDGGYEYYSGPAYPATTAAGPAPRPAGVPDRQPEFSASRGIEEGKRRLRAADYKGAVDEFRSAVVSTPDDPLAQAWFAIALSLFGDGKNADKAIRAAAGKFAPDRLSIRDLFRDEKERVRVIVALAKTGGEGSLAAAFALSRAGEPAKLAQMAGADPVAQKLVVKP